MFSIAPFFGAGNISICFCIPFIFYHFQQVLFTVRFSSLLSPLNDASIKVVDDDGSFQFSPEFTSPFYVHITLAMFLLPLQYWSRIPVFTRYESVKDILNFLALKWLLNELLLETEWSEVMFIWCFVWIKFIRSFF